MTQESPMKFLPLLSLTVLIAPSINAMVKEKTVTSKEEPSILMLSIAQRALALRITMINCLDRKDYVSASHIISKTKLHPGNMFIQRLEIGRFIHRLEPGVHINKQTEHQYDICYQLYIVSKKENHKRTLRLLSDAFCLPRIHIISMKDNNFRGKVRKEKEYKTQWNLFLVAGIELDDMNGIKEWEKTAEEREKTAEEREKEILEHRDLYLAKCRTNYFPNQKPIKNLELLKQ